MSNRRHARTHIPAHQFTDADVVTGTAMFTRPSSSFEEVQEREAWDTIGTGQCEHCGQRIRLLKCPPGCVCPDCGKPGIHMECPRCGRNVLIYEEAHA